MVKVTIDHDGMITNYQADGSYLCMVTDCVEGAAIQTASFGYALKNPMIIAELACGQVCAAHPDLNDRMDALFAFLNYVDEIISREPEMTAGLSGRCADHDDER